VVLWLSIGCRYCLLDISALNSLRSEPVKTLIDYISEEITMTAIERTFAPEEGPPLLASAGGLDD